MSTACLSDTHVTRAWSCTVRLVVADPRVLSPAARDLDALLARVDTAASRFRDDSALSRANRLAGRPVPVPRLLVDLVGAALDAAAATDGLVDPTLGLAMRRIGYDRDISMLADSDTDTDTDSDTDSDTDADTTPTRAGGWRSVRVHREAGLLTVPRGSSLDLGATAKAWTADHAARTLADRYGTAVLVELGGDLAVAGTNAAGWRVRIAEREGGTGPLITLSTGGLTTSSTMVRRWRRAGAQLHHIIDPRTGRPADGPWRTATVAAGTALAANVASTAAIVLGTDAPAWLESRGHTARLVDHDGAVRTVGDWPAVEQNFPTADGIAPSNAVSRGEPRSAAALAGRAVTAGASR